MTTVTSGEGEPFLIIKKKNYEEKRKHRIVLYDCLIKTKHFAEDKNQSIECDVCPISAG